MQRNNDQAASRRRKGIIAGVAGAALLLGGSTFAMWQQSSTASSGTIVSGKMNLGSITSPTWYDISPDRSVQTIGDSTALASYLISPGDTLQAEYNTSIELQGKNLVAALNVAAGGSASSNFDAARDLKFEYDVLVNGVSIFTAGTNGDTWQTGTLSTTQQAIGHFAQSGSNQAGVDDVKGVTGVTPVVIKIKADFPKGSTDQASMEKTAALGNLTFTLTQDRDAAHGDFS